VTDFVATFVDTGAPNFGCGASPGSPPEPADLGGEVINYFGSFGENLAHFRLGAGGATKLYGDLALVDFVGFDTFTLPWHAGNNRYEGSVSGFAAFLGGLDPDVEFSITVQAEPSGKGGGNDPYYEEALRRRKKKPGAKMRIAKA